MKQRRKDPVAGDRVKLRGRQPKGMVETVNAVTKWCRVRWDKGDGPTICHLDELEADEGIGTGSRDRTES